MKKIRVLVVEDNPDIRLILRKLLEREGFSVDMADSGHGPGRERRVPNGCVGRKKLT